MKIGISAKLMGDVNILVCQIRILVETQLD
jgi:hypothetical protein